MQEPVALPLIDQVDRQDEWLDARRKGLGGSDVAALFGCSPWVSPWTLYQDKIGELPKRPDDAVLSVGHELEPLTRRMFEAETGRKVDSAQERFRHPELEFMLANIDGSLDPVEDFVGRGVFEGKTTNPYAKQDWLQGVPIYYLLQITHYMIVTGRSWGSVAVLILGEDEPLMWADVELDTELAEMMIETETKFWRENVEQRVPPPVDGHTATTEALKLMHPLDTGLVTQLDETAMEWREELTYATSNAKEAKDQVQTLKNKIRAAMGDYTYGELPDGTGFSLKTTDKKETVVKATSYRTLRNMKAAAMGKAKRAAEKTMERMLAL